MTLNKILEYKPKGTKYIFNTTLYNYDTKSGDPVGNRIMFTTQDKCIFTIILNEYHPKLEEGCIWNARGTNKPSSATLDTSTSKVIMRYEVAE